MPKRMIAGNDWSPLRRDADHAVIGPAKAIPVRMANGTAGTSPHDRVAGNSASTAATPPAAIAPRVACHRATPWTMSRARSGVAAIARYA